MKTTQVLRQPVWLACLIVLAAPAVRSAESTSPKTDAIGRIREEGLEHSQVAQTLSYLTDVIGPRLTASPNLKRANEWTRDKLASWGLTNAHLEAWGPFGRGWSLQRFSAQVVEPQAIPLIGYPSAWSPGLEKPLVADVVYFDARNNDDLEKFKGKLKGTVVLSGALRELTTPFQPVARRLGETNLLALANAGERSTASPSGTIISGRFGGFAGGGQRRSGASGDASVSSTNRSRFGAGAGGGPGNRLAAVTRFRGGNRFLSFLTKEEAAVVVSGSSQGDAGTFFVSQASVPQPESSTNSFANAPRAWSTNAPPMPPQITIAAEDYNRMVRMVQQGEKLKMAVDLQVKFHDDDLMAYNTVAEIPGTDLKNEIVMLGGHMDSWHAGTGATDNGAGVAATMEAVRILTALNLKPRRTIRIALWSGEEQGLLGSRAYVNKHFGYYTNAPADSPALRSPKDEESSVAPGSARSTSTNSPAPARKLIRQHEYDKLSAYFNLDNGAGKIRGVYLQGNEAVRPLFRRWLDPFADLGADTITLANTGGTDHTSFDAVGLPGFQFIQDPLDYNSRTHHSNEDVFDRVPADDLKQASVILAAFAYQAAMMDDPLPRKPSE